MRQAAGAVDEVDQCRTLRAQGAAIDRVIGIALDVEDARSGILRAIAEAVHENATGDRTIRARVARFGGARELEFAHFGKRSGGREAKQDEARPGQGGARYLQKLAPRHISHCNPPCMPADRRSLYPSGKGLQGSRALSAGTHACLFVRLKVNAQCSEKPAW